jgi:Peptidase dimerisation domain
MDKSVAPSEKSPPALIATRRQRQMWWRVASMTGSADLHVHSLWSDGAQRPDAIVRAAAGRVHVVVITDHDEIRGAQAARTYAIDLIHVVPAEATAEIDCRVLTGDDPEEVVEWVRSPHFRVHGVDERVSLENIRAGVRIYAEVLLELLGPGRP